MSGTTQPLRLAEELDELYVAGTSPRDCHVGSSPASSPVVVRSGAATLQWSPPASPPHGVATLVGQQLTRVSSGVMDIPTAENTEEGTRAALVGPSQLPQLAAVCFPVQLRQAVEGGPQLDATDNAGTPRKFGPSDFDILSLVGQGAFGKVFQVRRRDDNRIFALKVMKKSVILEKNQTEYMRTERDVLTRVDHPYIVTLHASFQTPNKLYLVLDFINGGHLFFQLHRAGIFEEPLARVYAAEIVLALKHLHSLGIVHRDLKPENILLDAEGHIRITDFGLAAIIRDGSRNNSLVGTIDYMAPEIIAGSGHSKAADWWSLGVLIFEMLTGSAPFRAKNRAMMQKKILTEKVKMPSFLSTAAHRLLTALMQRDEAKRLGSRPQDGSADVQQHEFFRGVQWQLLEQRQLPAPFKPVVASELCTANFDEVYTKKPALDSPGSTPDVGVTNPFLGYTYSRESMLLSQPQQR